MFTPAVLSVSFALLLTQIVISTPYHLVLVKLVRHLPSRNYFKKRLFNRMKI